MDMEKQLKMNVYTAGVQMTINWANHEEYRLGKKLLMDMGACFAESNGDSPEFFGLENEQQVEALFNFRKSLTEKKKT